MLPSDSSPVRQAAASCIAGDLVVGIDTPLEVERPPKWPFRLLVFPTLVTVWPILLVVSQKALVPLGILLLGTGVRRAGRDVLVVAVTVAAGAGVLLIQDGNEFAFQHFFGFAIFVVATLLVNQGIRAGRQQLVRILAIVTLTNSALAFLVYATKPDLTALRGLNLVTNQYGETDRLYLETASLIAVFTVAFVRNRVGRVLSWLIVLCYALFLAKSLFVLTLFLVNRYAYLFARKRLMTVILLAIGLIMLAVAIPMGLSVYRPDLTLSVGMKLLQFDLITDNLDRLWLGHGWGYSIDQVASATDQPYQIEMQLPMLLAQGGLPFAMVYVAGMYLLIRSVSKRASVAVYRWLVYIGIGFVNPWLFIPSWYITSVLLFANFEEAEAV